MSNTIIFDNFSTIRNTTVESSSSEEDQRDDQDKLDKLYEFIGAPNPLPEEKKTYSSDVKTAYKLNFTQLPSVLYSASTTDHSMFENINKIEDEITQTLYNLKNPEKESVQPVQPINSTKTLFNVYPRSDSRLVYMKYKDQGDWELNLKGYANYLINVSNLIRTKEVKIQYLSRNVVNIPPVINPRPNALHFNSNFESGNLYSAFKISEFEYDLILQNDINSRGHTQWFFFSIDNAVKGRTIKFNMVNLLKPESLFNEGMKPLVFSTKDNESRGDGWKRAGFDVSYTRNNIIKEGGCNKSYYTLSFSYTFKEDNDIVYFAHCFPYTYTDLKAFLTKICADPARKMYIVRKTLCYTLAQNECEYLSITSPYNLENVDKRCGIVITARQHPGESLSSYMMEGFIEWITSEDPEAQYLRRYCVFKVVPMLNPDGVIHGNYRSSLCGRDLNRIWNKASPLLHPTVYHTKELIRKLQTRRRLHLICDLHGHSRKKNAFFYGNASEANPYKARMFPLIMSKVSKYVAFEDCRFAVQRSKESTARIALWREHKSENIFTLEASFFGYNQGGEIVHFTKEDYRKLGADLGKAIFIQLKQMNMENLKTSAVQTTGVYRDTQEASISKTKPAAKDLASRRRSLSMQMDGEEGENEEKGKKVFLEDQIKPNVPLRTSELMNSNNLLQELKANKKLIEMGNKDDSGSDTDLTDEDISNKELQKVLPGKSQGKLKKKKTKDGKKKTGSAAQTKRDEEKDKKEQATKVDGATNTTLGVNNKLKQELAANALIKPKTMKKFRVVTRDSATQQRLYSAGTGKDVANPLEMVSIGVQTDEGGVWDYNEQEVGPGEKGILYPFPKAFGRSKSPQATSSARGRILFIQGEKTGVDISSGIDLNYKLGKNQISRSILAKLNPKMLTTTNANNNPVVFNQNMENKREYQGFVGHIKKLGSIQISNQEVRAKMSVVKQIEQDGKVGNNKEMNAAYYMKYKEIENKVNANRPDSFNTIERTDETRNNYRKSAHASSLENSEKKHTNSLRNLENNDPLSEDRDHIPGASSSNQKTFNFNNNNKQRLNSKDKPPVPLPRLLPMISRRIDNKEPLATDVSSFINNTRKMVNGEEFADDSFAKAKLLKFTGGQQNVKGGSCITSGRESIDLNTAEKSKERSGAAELFRENYGQSRMSDYPGSSVAKERPKSPKKRSSAKLERIVSTDVKVNLEKKALIGAFNIVSPAHAGGRRSQNSVLKKF